MKRDIIFLALGIGLGTSGNLLCITGSWWWLLPLLACAIAWGFLATRRGQ